MARTKYYHADEVAGILDISIQEVYTMLKERELIGHKSKGRWLINMDQPKLHKKTTIQYIEDEEHEDLIYRKLNSVKKSLFIATANFRSVYYKGKSLVSLLNDLSKRGVCVIVVCARLQTYEERQFTLIECPRNHMKMFIFDSSEVYLGSANITSAAIMDRSASSRKTNNHEAGIVTNDMTIIYQAMMHFVSILSNTDCMSCKIKTCKNRDKKLEPIKLDF